MRFHIHNGLLKPTENDEEGLPFSKHHLRVSQINPSFTYSTDLQKHLQGKKLLIDEIPFPFELIHRHYENGYIEYEYGLEKSNKQFRCNRCNNRDQSMIASFKCARCGEHCSYCRACILMGRVSECTPLLNWTGPESEIRQPEFKAMQWEGQLSKEQQKGSDRMLDALKNKDDLLIWAVCGAGKTEMLFKGIEQALLENKQVCIATPRMDVVLELAPRLKSVFPQAEIAALYGGSEDRFKQANLTISTTHQLLRFKQTFDLMVIDEVDAFPYSADQSLQFAAERARKEHSSLIYLTATPSDALKKQIVNQVKIPQRYHGHPLPVPVFSWCGNYKRALQKGCLPKNVQAWITSQLEFKKQAFLFVPSIPVLEATTALLKKQNPLIEGVYAEDPNRKEKVQRFRNGEVPIIITTTILERGVTIPNSDVAVLGAEDNVFTESALVQIAGRVGRSAKHPSGDVRFFHYGKTEAMIRAKKHIQMMNEDAKKVTL
ncbi:DEAD/DEAH box helicase [[Brevibacterium] frigoritolerans]|uniref:DEAD/DEAH box helicase n=1 Tax=Peribacillus frigoritolerans TaxID=450367 RepID=UPI00105AAF2B|nr:DEAD/DEAH box helicase [Peribacillus frigoritolerans]